MAPLPPFPWIDVVDHPRARRAERRVRDVRAGDRLVAQGAAGGDGARRASAARAPRSTLAADPGKFLSTVQIGITLIGDPRRAPIRARAWAGRPRRGCRLLGLSRARPRRPLGFALVIGAHHLRLADRRRAGAQAVRAALARADRGGGGAADAWLSRSTAPLVWLLDSTSALLFRLIGLQPRDRGSGHRRGAPPDRRRGVASRA